MRQALRDHVRRRAGNRCEYCRLRPEHDRFHFFHVEHIVARKHGGTDEVENLALACQQCNLHKGTNLTGRDPDTNEIIRLFDPRKDRWDEPLRARRKSRRWAHNRMGASDELRGTRGVARDAHGIG